MPVEILMPELGESVHDGTVSRWLKKVGDKVTEDEPIVEIMTDKVNTELPSPATGVLAKILIQEGEPVEVFHVMGVILEEGESDAELGKPTETAPPSAASEPPVETPLEVSPVDTVRDGRRWYSPVVRSIAKKEGLSEGDLERIEGTGAGGRVSKHDVEAFLAGRRDSGKPATPAPAAKPAPIGDADIVPLIGMRKMIADAMVRSSQVPTVSTIIRVDVTELVKFREGVKAAFEAQHGVKLTFTPLFIKSITESLLEFPLLNASLQGDKIHMNRSVNMGVAVALGKSGDEGLIVPVIRQCETKGLPELARDLDDIAKRARNNTLGVADVQGGTFTLTNPGSYGALLGTPMINSPQAGILGTYSIEKAPLIVNDMIAIRSVMNLVLTYDHRIVDGLLAGRFLQSLKKRLEAPDYWK